jgi:predicted nuclease of restriction endonuclease-like (RecB) superfamily
MNHLISGDKEYKTWLKDLKSRIQSSQLKAAVKVSQQLLELYWELGKEISERQQSSSWGDALIGQLSKDLTAAFPGMKGFSKRNLFYIRQWYLFYRDSLEKVPQAVALIPWGHNREIIYKWKNIDDALFYVQQTI